MFSPRRALEDFLAKYIYLADIRKTPEQFVSESLKNLAIAAVASTTLSCLIAAFMLGLAPPIMPTQVIQNIAFLIPVPVIIALLMVFEPYFKAQEHMRGAERELLYVTTLLTTYAANGLPPHVAFQRLKKYSDLFPEMTKIVNRIDRIKTLFIVDEIEAMETEGRKVTSSFISDLLLSAASLERRGGDMYSAMRDKMRSIFMEIKEKYKSLADRMKIVGDTILIFYGVMPLTLYTMFALFASEDMTLQSIFYSFVVNPLVGVALVYLIDALYPKTPVRYTSYYRKTLYFIPVGVAVFIAMYSVSYFGLLKPKVISGLPWTGVALASALIAVIAPIAIQFYRDNRRLISIDYALPSFIRDITEEVKKGNTPAQAIISLSKSRSYGKHLDKIVNKMAVVIEAGRTFKEAYETIKDDLSWRSKLILALMVEANVMGAKPEVFEEVTEVTREIIDALKIARSSTSPLRIFGLSTAALVIGVTAMLIRQVLEPIAKMAKNIYATAAMSNLGVSLGINLITPQQLPSLVDTIIAGSVVTMFMLGLLTGKMTDGALVSGYQYAIITLLISIAMVLVFFLII